MSRARDFADLAGSADAGGITGRNLVINGAMQVAQRGTSSTNSGLYTVDRFQSTYSSVDEAPTQAQVDVASGTTPYSLGFRKAYRITNGNQTSGAGTGDILSYRYIFEAQDIANSGWDYTSSSSYVTLSFWAKSSVAQTFYGHMKTFDGTVYNYPFSLGGLSADTWTKVTKTIPGNSGLQIDNDNGQGLEFRIYMFLGTDRTASVTENAWAAYDNTQRTPDNTSTWYTTNDATFEITGVQLEVGEKATPFEHRSFADELHRCQRYGFGNTAPVHTVIRRNANDYAYMQITAPTPLRAAPSIVVNNDGVMADFDSVIDQTCTSFSIAENDFDAANIQYRCVADGISKGTPVAHQSMDIFFDAEL